jgi:hypothetical protein
MLVARFLCFACVLQGTQLCSVGGHSIFDSAATVLSVAEYLHHRGVLGFLPRLDFFLTYDRVSSQ